MIKYYKILESSGNSTFVKSKKQEKETIEIWCHKEEDPFAICKKTGGYYAIEKKKLVYRCRYGENWEKTIKSYLAITEEKYKEILNELLEKI